MLEEVVKDGVIALVRVMATDTWPAARKDIVRLFLRKGENEQKTVAERLDHDAAKIADSSADASARVRDGLVAQWQVRLQNLVELHPGLANELRALERDIRERLPHEPATSTQNNFARDGGQVFGAQNGNVIVNQLPPVLPTPNRSRPACSGAGADG
ncbi:hypothetical protein [Nocardiopsis sp. MG754419]|uniref:hypothetical protein n=1 Tax=Nocardiopsis sp. MG754419 TaxID=2259865 RepID=UPI001BABAC68|nr:hypothetical protein [Nocardiopsis sp. MG754419]MBR8741817.1 hypothetical protein [Nocardiopsis sp. MG754419]